jgi:quinol-cytochrome oxidoreductase complex cytochrome b subunit
VTEASREQSRSKQRKENQKMNRYQALIIVWLAMVGFCLLGYLGGGASGSPSDFAGGIGYAFGYLILAPLLVGTPLWAIGLGIYLVIIKATTGGERNE